MNEAVHKADILVEALGWITQFRGRYVVIKLGGSVLDEKDAVRSFLTDVRFLASVGMKPVLVHGGGKSISQVHDGRGHSTTVCPRMGCRPTTARSKSWPTRWPRFVDRPSPNSAGRGPTPSASISMGRNCLIAKKLTLDGPNGESLDLGRVGEVVDIDRSAIEEATRGRAIPVIPSIALDSSGGKLNVNADTAAAAVARFLGAEKLVFLSDVPGIFRDRKDPAHADFAPPREPLPRFDCRRSH